MSCIGSEPRVTCNNCEIIELWETWTSGKKSVLYSAESAHRSRHWLRDSRTYIVVSKRGLIEGAEHCFLSRHISRTALLSSRRDVTELGKWNFKLDSKSFVEFVCWHCSMFRDWIAAESELPVMKFLWSLIRKVTTDESVDWFVWWTHCACVRGSQLLFFNSSVQWARNLRASLTAEGLIMLRQSSYGL